MASLDRPRLRDLSAQRVIDRGAGRVALVDPLGVCPRPFVLAPDEFRAACLFDGARSAAEVRAELLREPGPAPTAAAIAELAARLDAALLLDGPSFEAFLRRDRAETVRPPAMAGRSYESSPARLRAQLADCFASPRGAGLPAPDRRTPGFRGVLSPHIDFHRGGTNYTWAYRELIERSDADVFVILGVAHQPCRRRFVLTRKDFDTPLGTVATDRAYVDRLAEAAGAHLFDDELVHRTEHSVEFQAVFLQYLLGDRRPFRIVPILAGSFHDLLARGVDPLTDPEVARFVAALRSAEAGFAGKVAYIGGVDFCHVGPEFGDRDPVDDRTLDRVRAFDRQMIGRAEAVDAPGWFGVASAVDNRWRVCGLAATYTMLRAIGPARGRLLRYDQAVDAARTCCVTFASVAFEAPG